jgi:hypothetical protein
MRGGFDPEDLDWTDDTPDMSRWHMLAADVFGYRFAHYAEHLDVAKDRHTTLMPNDVRLLARAQQEVGTPSASLGHSKSRRRTSKPGRGPTRRRRPS